MGGLIGENADCRLAVRGRRLFQCYSVGSVRGKSHVGGLVGSALYGGTEGCFWDTQTSGQSVSAGGVGKTTGEMQDPNTFMAGGWDFVGPADGPQDIWAEPAGGGYPILSWQLPVGFGLPIFSGGTGKPDDPYRISTAAELNSIGYNPRLMKAYFELVADTDLAGIGFYIIGNELFPFTGSFNGNGHIVSRLTATCGLFGVLGFGGEVKNLAVMDVDVTGRTNVGGLVCSNSGTVIHCCSTGTVSGDSTVGGLVGVNYATVSRCHSAATVSSSGTVVGVVGGLVGSNGGTVTDCYNTGAVSGHSYVGGLVGHNMPNSTITESYSFSTVGGLTDVGGLLGLNYNNAIVAHCYSAGAVSGKDRIGGLLGGNQRLYTSTGTLYATGIVTQCFWDTQTSGQTTSDGGTGKTTAEMQTASTFLEASWDFVGETENDSEDIWWILEGQDYPRLWWQAAEE